MKAPITGTVVHVSKRGTEVHLAADPKRYRGYKQTPYHDDTIDPRCKTAPIFKWYGIRPGDVVTLHWCGFAYLNIASVDVVKRRR